MTIRRADQFTARVIRGVAFNEGISLYENTGTNAAPTAGDGLDLSAWPGLQLAARPEGLEGAQYAIRGTVVYEFQNPARIRIAISALELEKAVIDTPTGAELRPVRITVRAVDAALQERVVLNGVLQLLPGGFTA
jgi:hypothetical protein